MQSNRKQIKQLRIRCMILLLLLIIGNPIMLHSSRQESTKEQQSGDFLVFENIEYEQIAWDSKVDLPARTSLSYAWIYMQEEDNIHITGTSSDILYIGITGNSGQQINGIGKSDEFAVTFVTSHSGYYKIFFVNSTNQRLALKNIDICVHRNQ